MDDHDTIAPFCLCVQHTVVKCSFLLFADLPFLGDVIPGAIVTKPVSTRQLMCSVHPFLYNLIAALPQQLVHIHAQTHPPFLISCGSFCLSFYVAIFVTIRARSSLGRTEKVCGTRRNPHTPTIEKFSASAFSQSGVFVCRNAWKSFQCSRISPRKKHSPNFHYT